MSIVHISFYPSDWLAGTRGLSAEESGVYITLIARIYEMAGPIERDDDRLSRLCGCKSKIAFIKALEYLMSEGKIIEVDGLLSNERAQKEIEKTTEKSSKAREAAESRWKRKPNKNNDGPSANASPEHMHTGCQSEPELELEKKGEPNGSPKKERKPKQGTSLDEDWRPSEKTIQTLIEKGYPRDAQREQFWRFQNHFLSTSTASGRKKDWDRTYANWITDPRNKPRGYQQQQHPLAQAFDELSDDIRRAENRSEPVPTRQASDDGATVIELTAVGGRNHGWPEAGRSDSAEDGDNPLRLFPVERFR